MTGDMALFYVNKSSSNHKGRKNQPEMALELYIDKVAVGRKNYSSVVMTNNDHYSSWTAMMPCAKLTSLRLWVRESVVGQ